MSDRRDPYYDQLVSDGDVGQWHDDLERADRSQCVDLGFIGIMSGLVASQHSTGNYTVDVTGGVAYDQAGQRIYVPSTQNVDLSVDHLSASTNVSAPSHSKVVSLFIKFNRLLQNPKTDGNNQTVYYDRLESYAWYVKQGAEANTGSEVPPTKESDGILICNVTLNYSASPQQILTGAIATTTRDDLVAITGTPVSIRRGKLSDALADLVAALNSASVGSGVSFAGGSSSWADGSHLSTGTVQSAIDAAVNVLGSTTSSSSGGRKVGVESIVGSFVTIVAGSVYAQLSALQNAANLEVRTNGTWANGDTTTAAILSTYLNTSIVGMLAASTGNGGTTRIGGVAIPTLTSGAAIAAGTLSSQLVALKSNANIDATALTGTGFNLAAGSVRSQLQSVANQAVSLAALAAQTAPTGETLVGGKALTGASFNLSAGTLEAQIQAIINTAAPYDDVQEFTSSGTWTKPSWAAATSDVDVILVGPGAGGGGGASGSGTSGGSGGGGGTVTRRRVKAGLLGSTVAVTAPAGGAGGGGGVDGTSGSNATFGSHFKASGGEHGVAGTAGSTTGGVGGTGEFNGGNGGNGTAGAANGGAGNAAAAAAGGGAGGGVDNTNIGHGGGSGGVPYGSGSSAGSPGAGAGSGGAGGNGGDAATPTGWPGGGGGGGGGGVGGPGGNGGAGKVGGGGGGGGSSLGFTPGSGGAGGNAYCLVITSP